jgi:glycosyltransferase involved in cell wall biosynthesis
MNVGILAEGMYPYATGGVASWLHQLIRSLPEITFTVIAIVPDLKKPRERKYPQLPNVDRVVDLPLYEERVSPTACRHATAADWDKVVRFHEQFKFGDLEGFPDIVSSVADPQTRAIDLHQALFSKSSFETLTRMYRQFTGDSVPFLDYFWTWRGIHTPLFSVLQAELPRCDLYHSTSTGFAGLLGAVARQRLGVPFLLTEHGIYASERRQELWELLFRERPETAGWDTSLRRLFKRWWGRFFGVLAQLAYKQADWITTITAANVPSQVRDGADPKKVEVVSVGTSIERVRRLREARGPAVPGRLHVALVGRVVPFKDVKSFLHMGKVLLAEQPNARLFVFGPTDQDEPYYRQCQSLAAALHVEDKIEFKGEANVADIYRQVDVVVLSSIREVQPLVIMEANGCGVPCVATSVGACQEMIEGRDEEDRRLGPSGGVVRPGNPGELARAVATIGSNPGLWRQMSQAGIARVERYYDERIGWQRYREIYESLCPSRAAP